MTRAASDHIHKSLADWPYRRVFLTGATGLIGGQLLSELLHLPQVEEVTCLVRSSNGKEPVERLGQRLKRGGMRSERLRKAETRVRVAEGEITKEMWGMSEAELDRMRGSTDLFIHCAASTSFVDTQSCEAINVTGTRRMLEVLQGAQSLKRLVHFSTATLCGYLPNRVITEDEALNSGAEHMVAYTYSKAEGERLLWAQADKLPLLVVRPSITMARASQDRKHARLFLWSMVAMVELPYVPVNRDSRIDIVPLDFVVDSTMRLIARGDNLKHNCYHLTAGERAAVTAGQIRDVACAASNVDGPVFIPPEQWDPSMERSLAEQGLSSLYEALLLYLPFINLNLVYDNTRLIEELGDNLPALPKFTDYVCRMLHTMVPERMPLSAVEAFGR